MEIRAFYDEDTFTLTYLVFDAKTRDAVIIDPVLDYDPKSSKTSTSSADALIAAVREQELNVGWILETHAHADHLTSSQLLAKELDAQIAIGEHITEVQRTFRDVFDFGSDFPVDGSQFDRLLTDGETLSVGPLDIEVLHTPGHTPACVSYLVGNAVFTGDALFMHDYGTGRCDFPRGSAKAMYHSITTKLYTLPDDTRVFVGHDYQPNGRELAYETTIGKSKAENPQLRASTTEEEFVKFRQARDATLAAPRLLLPSVQVNVDAGRLPKPHANGMRYLTIPLNLGNPTDETGRPAK